MPFSDNSLDSASEQFLRRLSLASVLDIGAGAGKFGRMVRACSPRVVQTAVEIEADYIETYKLEKIYNTVWCMHARDLVDKCLDDSFDLAIMGDCLEHMRKSEGVDLLNFLAYRVRHMLIIYPERYIQGSWNGYRSEAHISFWTLRDFEGLDFASLRLGRMVLVGVNGYLWRPEADVSVHDVLRNMYF